MCKEELVDSKTGVTQVYEWIAPDLFFNGKLVYERW